MAFMKPLFFSLLTYLFFLTSLLCTHPALAEQKPFRIGVVIPLSGDLAYVGDDIRRGMELAVADLNNENQVVELIFEDNQFTATKTVSAAKKLADQDNVDAFVSLWDMADLVAITAERKKIPHLSIRWNPEVARKNTYTFTLESTYESVVGSQIDLLQSIGVNRLAVVGSESKSPAIAADEAERRAKKAGLEVVYSKRVPSIDVSFNSIVSSAVASQPDVLMFHFFSPNIELALRKSQAYKTRLLRYGLFNEIPDNEKHLAEGLPFVRMYRASEWFKEKFRAEYGQDFLVRAPHAYDIVSLLTKGAMTAQEQSLSRTDAIVKYLHNVRDYEGASGKLSTNDSKSIETEVVWMIMEDAKPREATEEDLSRLAARVREIQAGRKVKDVS